MGRVIYLLERTMLDFDSARELLTQRVRCLAPVTLGLGDALGCRLAESPRSTTDLPATDVSTMDGYAVRAADLAAQRALSVAFEVPAGDPARELPPQTAARIFTGAVIPNGADTVVPQERAQVQPDGAVLLEVLSSGSFVRNKAELCSAGDPLCEPGDLVTPQVIALLATAGATRISVTPRPRVAIISTGSELVPIEQRPAPGQIRDSNGSTLAALARRADFLTVDVSSAADNLDALRRALARAAAEADLVVTSGGVSVGDYDLVPGALDDLGAETIFHRLSVKPGKPVLAARLGDAWVIGLPGNPVSTLVGWRLFVQPVGERLAGNPHAFDESPRRAQLASPASNSGNRTTFAPALLEADHPLPRVTVLPLKGSHDVVAAARANALVVLEIGCEHAAGAEVSYYGLDGATP